MMHNIAFAIVAACTLWSAVGVVRDADLIHAVLWLGIALLATALLYAMLGASFFAAVQVLLYVGGVVTLMIFGVMITRRHQGIVVAADSQGVGKGLLVSLTLFGVMALAIWTTPNLDETSPPPAAVTPAQIGRGLVLDHILAFELLSMLLLATMIGAIVIARRHEPGTKRIQQRRKVAAEELSP
jgi:NADH:ubiquinone oxidoreductase subunit 6 (subunit J)